MAPSIEGQTSAPNCGVGLISGTDNLKYYLAPSSVQSIFLCHLANRCQFISLIGLTRSRSLSQLTLASSQARDGLLQRNSAVNVDALCDNARPQRCICLGG